MNFKETKYVTMEEVECVRRKLDQKPPREQSVLEIFEEIAEDICDEYCVYNKLLKDGEELARHCQECPLNRLGI